MTRRRYAWLVIVVVAGVVGIITAGLFAFAGVVSIITVGVRVRVGAINVAAGVGAAVFCFAITRGLSRRIRAGDRGRRGRGAPSSGLSHRLGSLRVSGEGMRHLLSACTSVDRLVDYLLDRAAGKLPEALRARFAEEWHDHREHYAGWRLVWWALCVRATAMRTVAALGPSPLSRDN